MAEAREAQKRKEENDRAALEGKLRAAMQPTRRNPLPYGSVEDSE